MVRRNLLLIAMECAGFAALCGVGSCVRDEPAKPPSSVQSDHPLSEGFYIKVVVLKDFFDVQSKGGNVEKAYYSAYVINDKNDGNELVKTFAEYVPKVSNTIDVSTSTGEARDQSTGKPVKLFSITIYDQSSDSATVRANSYESNHASEMDEYLLKKLGGRWVVANRRVIVAP